MAIKVQAKSSSKKQQRKIRLLLPSLTAILVGGTLHRFIAGDPTPVLSSSLAQALHLIGQEQQVSNNNSSDNSEASQPAAPLEEKISERVVFNYQPKSLGDDQRPSWETLEEEESGRKPLNFLHIPKTGGTSIFRLSASAGLKWADCLFPSSWGKSLCPDYNSTNKNWPKHPYDTPWWHTPIQYLDPSQPNPYDGFDLFAVVRNPYERAVSEYYYYCKFHKKTCFGANQDQDTAERLNTNLQGILKRVLLAPKHTADYYMHWGHWIPQYDYFFDTTTISDRGPPAAQRAAEC